MNNFSPIKNTPGALPKPFKPAWWLQDGHSQTLWRKVSPPAGIDLRRQRIELDDGDFIDLDWATETDPQDSTDNTIVFHLHGLCGCSSSPYIVALQSLLNNNKLASLAMNFRGCSGEVNRLARAYHSGISEDVNEVFTKLLGLYPEHNFVFVGYSLGANVLLKWLGEIQGHPRIKKAVAVSTPFSLALCSKAMLNGLSRLYGKYFVQRLVKDFRQKQRHFDAIGNTEQSQRIKELGDPGGISTIWEFDDMITAPLHGFDGAEDYYNRCSSISFLDAIETETLLIQSENDPLIPMSALQFQQVGRNPNVQLQISPKGGHVGFISANRENWLEQRILNFIQA